MPWIQMYRENSYNTWDPITEKMIGWYNCLIYKIECDLIGLEFIRLNVIWYKDQMTYDQIIRGTVGKIWSQVLRNNVWDMISNTLSTGTKQIGLATWLKHWSVFIHGDSLYYGQPIQCLVATNKEL